MSGEGESNGRLERAVAYGCISLNGAFVVRNKRLRIFKKRALRLSVPEMIWIILSTIFFVGVLALAVMVLSLIPILQNLVSYLMLVLAPFLGWFTGRRIARASPYRRFSGEGLGEYLWVQSDKLGPILGRLVGRKFAMSEVTTAASGKLLTVECVEWIGTSRAQLMPKYLPSRRNTSVDVILVPSTVSTDWARRLQHNRIQSGRKSFE